MLLTAVSLISGAALAFEILLMRLFAIVQWHHFAYMMISVALLGYGASGALLFLAGARLRARLTPAFAAGAVLFGLTAIAAFALGQRVPLNPLELVWAPRQALYLGLLYLVLMVPFLCAASCVGLALSSFGARIGAVYRADLIGAGAGALAIVALLFALPPTFCLRLVGGLGVAAAAAACLAAEAGPWRRLAPGLAAGAVGLVALVPGSWTALQPSPFKGLSQALTVPGARVLGAHSSPLGHLTVVESPEVPFRHAPGLSLANTLEPAPQLGVFTDAGSMSVITRFDGRLEPLAYLDQQTSALPYHLLERPAVLVLGAGGGADVLQAIHHRAASIDAVELDPSFARLLGETHRDFAGPILDGFGVRYHRAEARSFVARAERRWDLIQIPLLEAAGAATSGVQSLSEGYLYTREALRAYLRHLTPAGLLVVTRWLKLPPRDSLKLLATALDALAAEGVAAPARHVAMIRSWGTVSLLVGRSALERARVEKIAAFAEARAFDLAYHPGIAPDAVNRFNVLAEPYFHQGALALTGPGRADFLARYKFDLSPASDDRPYFYDFFRWRSLPELLALRAGGGAGLLEWGSLILVATLLQAAVLSLLLILGPLLLARRRGRSAPARAAMAGPVLGYFVALGLAFLFVEIAFIQRFTVFLGHPLYGASLVLGGFLLFAGLGSGWAPRLARRVAPPVARRLGGLGAVELAAGLIAALAIAYLALLPPLLERLLPWPDAARVAIALALLAPLAFAMGMPFPLGLERVSRASPALVPWAWGVNGCASVTGAVLAMILAVHFGFTLVVLAAVLLYLAAALMFRRLPAASG